MIRVGFVMAGLGQGWLGGVSYFRNLFGALADLPGRRLEPVLIVGRDDPADALAALGKFEFIRTPLVDIRSPWWPARRAAQLVLGRDIIFERFLRANRIDVLSHSGYLGRRCSIPSLAWIPDFQELHYPGFFSPQERAARALNAKRCSQHASLIILSSESAQADLNSLSPDGAIRSAVLRFVATVPDPSLLPSLADLQARYGFDTPYFHLPNQFWAHKNHLVVIEALARLRAQGRPVRVLATGNPSDHRQPEHMTLLIERARTLGVADLFVPLGMLPYADLMALMRHSVALINPSLFEGWSTTVEEGKSMGKCVVLSDLPVHREQAPARGVFFAPTDPEQLAARLHEVLSAHDPDADLLCIEGAWRALAGRRIGFAERFQHIVTGALDGPRRRAERDSHEQSRS